MSESENEILLALRAQDIQTGLQKFDVTSFETLLKIGMAARLAIHIRGQNALDYNVLKQLAHILFGIPNIAFTEVLRVLQEVEYVRVIGTESKGKMVLPSVPYFEDLYSALSEHGENEGLNEAEKASLEILNRLARGPVTKRAILTELGLHKNTANLVLSTGKAGAYIDSFRRSDGDEVLISPIYFSERPGELAVVVEKHGTESVVTVFDAIRKYPGWPLAAIRKNLAIGDITLHPEQVELVSSLASRGLLQPPSVETTHSGTNHFLFTPPIGSERIHVVEKEIYEKAMAIISAVRQGQHFAKYPVWSPRAVVNALQRDGFLRATSEAKEQWRGVALLRICELAPKGSWHEVHLIRTDENIKAIRLALQLLDHGDVTEDRGLDPQVRLMLHGGAAYHEALQGVVAIKSKLQVPGMESHTIEIVDELLEHIQKG